jgi:hypothetical protein
MDLSVDKSIEPINDYLQALVSKKVLPDGFKIQKKAINLIIPKFYIILKDN